jgi:hypothetical protein
MRRAESRPKAPLSKCSTAACSAAVRVTTSASLVALNCGADAPLDVFLKAACWPGWMRMSPNAQTTAGLLQAANQSMPDGAGQP